jgi:hypothetical protein
VRADHKFDWRILLGIGILVFCGFKLYSSYKQQTDQDAITIFYHQLVEVQKEHQPKFEEDTAKAWPTSGLYRSYYLSLNSLNVSACPPDFQQAWTDCLNKERACADDWEKHAGGVNFTIAVLEFKPLEIWDRDQIQSIIRTN